MHYTLTLALSCFVFSQLLWAADPYPEMNLRMGLGQILPRHPSIYEEYPQRFQAQSLEKIFTEDIDLPLPQKAISAQEFGQQWKQRAALGKNTQFAFYDLTSVYVLNLEAANIWHELVNCQSVTKQRQAQYARAAYFRGGDLCHGNEDRGEELQKQLEKLHSNVLDFLKTSKITSAVFHHGRSAIVPLPEQWKNFEQYNQQAGIIPQVHFLFVQVLLDIFVLNYPFVSIWPKMDYAPIYDRITDIFLSGIVVSDDKYLEDSLRLPYLKRRLRFGDLLLRNLSAESRAKAGMGEDRAYSEAEILRAKILHDIIFLFSYLPLGECQLWGLWPGLTSSLSHFVSDKDFPSRFLALNGRSEYFPMSIFPRKIGHSCGIRPSSVSVSPYYLANAPWEDPTSIYSPYRKDLDQGEELIEALRKMAKQYTP